MTKKQSTLMLMASSAAILTGILFVFLPNHSVPTFRLMNGAAWLMIGGLWSLAWRARRSGRDRR